MTISQKFKKIIYPMLKMAGRLIGMNGKKILNRRNTKPLIQLADLKAYSNQGASVKLDNYTGKYLLISNTASHCGYTAQYSELQQLQNRFADKLNVLAFPADDFGGQEPGSDEEIADFCSINFGVKFPVMMKSDVVGPKKNEVFAWLTDPAQNGWNAKEPTWNFCKYLVSPDGTLLGFFESGVSPLDEDITDIIR
jgi:glutathione peroxidase